jgi:hypothetical protein
MPKWVKTIVALLLLPFCFGAARALLRVLVQTGQAETLWIAVIGGAGCWLAVFLLLPKPLRLYVFGHELTHALSTWAFGGKVKKFKASPNGGHVVVTKSNFVIALAPYFFPLYAALVAGCFLFGDLLWGWARYLVWFHFLIGAAYAFHLTLTWHILQTRQSDITSHGYLFSGVIIFIGNMAVLLVGIPLLTQVPVLSSLGWWLRDSSEVLFRLRELLLQR